MDDFDPRPDHDDNDDHHDHADADADASDRDEARDGDDARVDVVEDADIVPLGFGDLGVETTAVRPFAVPRRSSTHRRFVRVRTDAVLLKVRVGQGALIARVVDISVGGCFCDVVHTIPYGAFVELTLLHPGVGEIVVAGVVVADATQRAGLAIRFASIDDDDARQLRRLIEQEHARDPGAVATDDRATDDRDDVDARDDELARLRAQVTTLRADNQRLQREADANAEAVALVGRLQLEVERLRRQARDDVRVDVAALGDIKRDVELAWTAVARLTDAVTRLR